jgi:hypothetical protein
MHIFGKLEQFLLALRRECRHKAREDVFDLPPPSPDFFEACRKSYDMTPNEHMKRYVFQLLLRQFQ